MPHIPWLVAVIIAFLLGAWLVQKHQGLNLIGNVTGM